MALYNSWLTEFRNIQERFPRTQFVARRISRLFGSLLIAVIATFFIIHFVPGDPVRAALGPSATAEHVAATKAHLGLDKPIGVQFFNFVANLSHGDLGNSIRLGAPVATVVGDRFVTTLTLAALGFAIAVAMSLPIGIGLALLARTQGFGFAKSVPSVLLGIIIAIPDFLIAVGLIMVFSVWLNWLPAAGWGNASSAVLPAMAVAAGPTAYLSRVVQVEMLRILDSTFLETARAKRLPLRFIILRHALPNIASTTLTVGGLVLGTLVGSTVVIETVFAIPGLGSTVVSAVTAKDYPLAQGVVLVFVVIVLSVNLLVDVLLITIDPRTSISEG